MPSAFRGLICVLVASFAAVAIGAPVNPDNLPTAVFDALASPVTFYRDIFNDDSQTCTSDEMLRMHIPPELLPRADSPAWTLSIQIDEADDTGYILALDGLAISKIGSTLSVENAAGGTLVRKTLPPLGLGSFRISLMRKGGAFTLCSGDASATLAPTVAGSIASGVTLGDRKALSTLQGLYSNVFVANHAFDTCAEASAITAPRPSGSATASVSSLTSSRGTEFDLSAPAVFSALASSSGRPVKLRVTVFGVPPGGCTRPECGNIHSDVEAGGSARATVTATFPRAGRYLVRATASDYSGAVAYKDLVVLVRKLNDSNNAAPCCRNTPHVIAGQEGRPVHSTEFDGAAARSLKNSLGWPSSYSSGQDLEVERLFNYAILAPLPRPSPLERYSCFDSRFAGAGSPQVQLGAYPELRGHGKRLLVVTGGYKAEDWSPTDIEQNLLCQNHWSGWQNDVPKDQVFTPRPGAGVNGAHAGKVCSMQCTPGAIRAHLDVAGTYDRWFEAVIEQSFGRTSFNPAIEIAEEQFFFKDDGGEGFGYHHVTAINHIEGTLGVNTDGSEYFLVKALFPLHWRVSPKVHGWFAGMEQPVLFYTHCNPSHYLNMHEGGHRFSFGHAEMFVTDDGFKAPSDPLGEGNVASRLGKGYTDETDIMACCHGDYSVYARLRAGFIRGPDERKVISRNELSTSKTIALNFCPYDRAECRDQFMALTMRPSDDETIVIGYRSMPFWPDVEVSGNNRNGEVEEKTGRPNLSGLSVLYTRRNTNGFDDRGLLNFNSLFGTFPEGLPRAKSAVPTVTQFSHLRPGYVWYDPEVKLLLVVHSTNPCEESDLTVTKWDYTVSDFYGFRGEKPFTETFERHDFSGYRSLQCLQATLTTQAPAPGHLGGSWLKLDSTLSAAPAVAPRAALRIDIPGETVVAAEWRDSRNQTFASGDLSVSVPLPTALEESAGSGKCTVGCWDRVSVKVATASGRHGLANIAIDSSSLLRGYTVSVEYFSYTLGGVERSSESLSAAAPALAARAPASAGISLFGNSGGSSAQQLADLGGAIVVTQDDLAGIGPQWTMSTRIKVAQPGPANQDKPIFERTVSSGLVEIPQPLLTLSKDQFSRDALKLTFGTVERYVSLNPISNSLSEGVYLQITRDGSRVSVWLDGKLQFVMDDIWCPPAHDYAKGCATAPFGSGTEFGSLTVGGAGAADLTLDHLRVYNYAMPMDDMGAEAVCTDLGDCGQFGIVDWEPSPEPQQPPEDPLGTSTFAFATGSWSDCSRTCGGGVQTRTVECIRTRPSGEQTRVSDADCGGAKPATSRPCNLAACTGSQIRSVASDSGPFLSCVSPLGVPGLMQRCQGLHLPGTYVSAAAQAGSGAPAEGFAEATAKLWASGALDFVIPGAWQVGAWSDCPGDCGQISQQTRSVVCLALDTKQPAEDVECDASARPAASRTCLPCPICRKPGSDGPDCSGRGDCSASGCSCEGGYRGTFCQFSPACATMQDARGDCCPSAHISVSSGLCCAAGEQLDRDGECCASGLDACGVCGGVAQTVDARGVCCPGPLDADGLCCVGRLDECGVCTGHNDCAITVLLGIKAVGRPNGLQSGDADLLSASLARTLSLPPSMLSVQPITQSLLDAVVSEPASPGDDSADGASRRRSLLALPDSVSSDFDAAQGPPVQLIINRLAGTVTERAEVPRDALSYAAVLSGLHGAAALGTTLVASPQMQLHSIVALYRSGSCGNGVCELGEQAETCPGDCLPAAGLCPTGASVPQSAAEVGDSAAQCSARGRCISGTQTCACHTGYSGPACEACAPGFVASAGFCALEYVASGTCVATGDTFTCPSGVPPAKGKSNDVVWWLVAVIAVALSFASLLIIALVARYKRSKAVDLENGQKLYGQSPTSGGASSAINSPSGASPHTASSAADGPKPHTVTFGNANL